MIKYILTFVAGAGIGSAVTYKLLKVKYEQFAQEQIDSVKETYQRRSKLKVLDELSEIVDEEVEEAIETGMSEKPDISVSDYANRLKDLGYTNYSDISAEKDEKKEEKEDKPEPMIDKPYVIPPEEYGDFDDYERINLLCFADNVVTDEDYELVDDVDDVIGLDSLNHFGDYEDDVVHVRNDRLKCDYEVLADPRKYSDIS